MAYELDPAEEIAAGIQRCAQEQLDHAVRALSEELSADPARAVHTARKAIKKERSLLRLARGALPARTRSRENAALRQVAASLAQARDAEVMVATLDDLAERFPQRLASDAFPELRKRLELERSQVTQIAAVAPAVEELQALRERTADWHLQREGWDALAPGLDRIYRLGGQDFRRAQQEPLLEHVHEWRKRVKDLWYSARLLRVVCGPSVRALGHETGRLADLLGDEHDLGVLSQTAQRAGAMGSAELEGLLELIAQRRRQLQAEALGIGHRVYAEKPKAFERRIRNLWEAGRDLDHGGGLPSSGGKPAGDLHR